MWIISRVCAEFHDPKGETLFQVTPAVRNLFIEAPDSIRQDPLFRMLVNDGSMQAADTYKGLAASEDDPMKGHDAEGKLIRQKMLISEAAAGLDGVSAGEGEAETAPAEKSGKTAKIAKAGKAMAAEQDNEKGGQA